MDTSFGSNRLFYGLLAPAPTAWPNEQFLRNHDFFRVPCLESIILRRIAIFMDTRQPGESIILMDHPHNLSLTTLRNDRSLRDNSPAISEHQLAKQTLTRRRCFSSCQTTLSASIPRSPLPRRSCPPRQPPPRDYRVSNYVPRQPSARNDTIRRFPQRPILPL